MNKINRLIMLNQMAGPLFRELAEELSLFFQKKTLLITGHPDTISMKFNVSSKVEIISAPIYNRKSHTTRIFSWFQYLFSCSGVILKSSNSDAFLISSNPPILFIWFRFLTLLRRRNFILIIYDIHPDIFVKMGLFSKKNPIFKLWFWINTKVFSDADAIITIGKGMANVIHSKYKVSFDKLFIIYPWVDTNVIRPIKYDDNYLIKDLNISNKSVILYSGNMGISHDIGSILEAAKNLRNRVDILFMFIGGGEKWQDAIDFKNQFNLENIKVLPYFSENLLPYSLSLSTISLVSLDKGAECLMVPSKLFYYMASGSPIIAISNGKNELRDVIESNKCGLCIESKNVDSLVNSIEKLVDNKDILDMYSLSSRKAAKEYYSKNTGIKLFLKILNDLNYISNE